MQKLIIPTNILLLKKDRSFSPLLFSVDPFL